MTYHCRLAARMAALTALALGVAGSGPADAVQLAQAPIAPGSPAPSQRPAQAQPPKPKPPQTQAPQAQSPKPSQAAKPTTPPPIGGGPQLLGQYGDWGAYTAAPGGQKLCFALAKPAKTQTDPPNRPRDPSFFFISTWPGKKVRDEVSVLFGYAFKPNADAAVEIGGANYAMYTQADGGWVKNAAEEPRLVDAMRKAGELTVKGASARGTSSADVYSLKGLAQALDRVAQECR